MINTAMIFGFLVALTMAFLATPCAIRLARTRRVLDAPGSRKVHTNPTPRLGGTAVFVAAVMSFFAAGFLFYRSEWSDYFTQKAAHLLFAATLMFLVGLWDDIRTIPARRKLLFQVLAALYLYSVGMRVQSVSLFEYTWTFPGWLSLALSLCWMVGITNAINLIDGLDGLAAGISCIASAALACVLMISGQIESALCLCMICGALAGFLFYNFNPAKIFMGDCGSLFLGFLLAGFSMTVFQGGRLRSYFIPVIILCVPIMDTLLIMLNRFTERRSIFSPDQKHFHHKLLSHGIPHRRVVLTIYGITFSCSLASLLILKIGLLWGGSVSLTAVAVTYWIFHQVGSIRINETVTKLRRKHSIESQIKHQRHACENIELYLQKAESLEQWWQAVCMAAREMNFSTMTLKSDKVGGTDTLFSWTHERAPKQTAGCFTMRVPVRHGPACPQYLLYVEISPDESYETSGHFLLLFARLIDKYGGIREETQEARISHQFLSSLEVAETTEETIGV